MRPNYGLVRFVLLRPGRPFAIEPRGELRLRAESGAHSSLRIGASRFVLSSSLPGANQTCIADNAFISASMNRRHVALDLRIIGLADSLPPGRSARTAVGMWIKANMFGLLKSNRVFTRLYT